MGLLPPPPLHHWWMSQVTYKWVMSRRNESCHVWMNHVTYESCHTHEWVYLLLLLCTLFPRALLRDLNRKFEKSSFHFLALARTCRYEWVMSHTNEAWLRFEWVMAHIWMSHGTHMKESWHTYAWVMAHISMSHETHINESWHTQMSHITYEWVMAHIWMSHETHINESYT